jgi:glycosyltransferase involved in cell wall biosynthesis
LGRDEVIAELDRSDAFVLPSTYETFGVVLIEALARGRPVIATACGGPEAFVLPEDGEIVPPGNEERLASAMVAMRSSRASYRDDQLRERAIERFGAEAFVEKIQRVYAAAIAT